MNIKRFISCTLVIFFNASVCVFSALVYDNWASCFIDVLSSLPLIADCNHGFGGGKLFIRGTIAPMILIQFDKIKVLCYFDFFLLVL